MIDDKTFLKKCRDVVGKEYVFEAEHDKIPYLTDWSGRFSGDALAVIKPSNVHEVSAITSLCHQNRIAIVTQGGNTGLCGGSVPNNLYKSVIISTKRLNKIHQVDVENSTMTLDAGVILSNAQEAAKNSGKLFPLSLAAEGSCTIGGNLATNAGGIQVLRYGNMRDLTLGLQVVTPTGEILNSLRGLRKDNTGYSLKDIYVGSEGTLGIITAATLKLFPLPKSKATALVGLTNIKACINLIELVRNMCDADLTAFELISTRALNLLPDQIKTLGEITKTHSGWVVLFELSSMESQEKSIAQLEFALESALDANLINDAVIASSLQQSKDLWSIRETIPEAQLKLGTIIKHDISLPISALPSFIEETKVKLNQFWGNMEPIIFGHVGDGNLHYNLAPINQDYSLDIEQKREAINQLVHDQVYKYSGSFSAEHGIGQSKLNELPQRKDATEMKLMYDIKRALDPTGIMNPGKILLTSSPVN